MPYVLTFLSPHEDITGESQKDPSISPLSNCSNSLILSKFVISELSERYHQWKKFDESYIMKKTFDSEAQKTRFEIEEPIVCVPVENVWYPFHQRPLLEEREVVGKFLPKLLPAIITEIQDWQASSVASSSSIHSLSIQLLRTLLIFSHDPSITHNVPKLVPTLFRALKIHSVETASKFSSECSKMVRID